MTWRATIDAEHDLDELTTYGGRQHGIVQALEYYDDLVAVFEMLAASPRLGPERIAGLQPIRLMRHKAHHILYALDGEDVVILRVLHGSANWIDLFSDDSR